MYWKHNGNSSQIDVILCKEDCRLQEVLDQEDLLQELRGQNLKLIEYLLRGDVIEELVSLIITEPSNEIPEKEQYKHANIACELLTCDLPALNERLASNHALLDKLYNFLDTESALNPLLASYFSRTLTILISRRSEQNWYSYQMTCLQALEFLKSKERFVELLLRHLGTSAIMDLTLNLITLIEDSKLKHNSRVWLLSQNIIQSLISLLSPSVDVDCQNNAAQLLCDIIYKLRYPMENDEIDPILAQLESTDMICFLMDTILSMEQLSETGVVGGLTVLMEILRPFSIPEPQSRRDVIYSVHDNNENYKTTDLSPHDSVDETLVLTKVVNGILPFIQRLKHVLLHPPQKPSINLTNGLIDPPLGKVRLHLVKCVTMLIALNNASINEELINLDVFTVLLDLFVKYSWNNFLHTEVEKCISYTIDFCDSFESLNDHCLFKHLLRNCRLLERLLDALEENEMNQHKGAHRKGYMGHLIRIFTIIYYTENKNTLARELIDSYLDENYAQAWRKFKTCCLYRLVELHSTPLGGVCPRPMHNENDVIEDIRDLTAENKSFKMENNSTGTYSDDDEKTAEASNDFISLNGDAEVSDDQIEKREDMFNTICAQKWQSVSKDLNTWDDDETDIFNEANNNSSLLARMNKELAVNEETNEVLVVKNADQKKDPWSKIGNVSNPWANEAFSNEQTLDSNWATFDESLTDVFFNSDANDIRNRNNNFATEMSSVEESFLGNQFGTIGEKSEKRNYEQNDGYNIINNNNNNNSSLSFEEGNAFDSDFKDSSLESPSCDNICGSLFASDVVGNFFVHDLDGPTVFYESSDEFIKDKKQLPNEQSDDNVVEEHVDKNNESNNENDEKSTISLCNGNAESFDDRNFVELRIKEQGKSDDQNDKFVSVDNNNKTDSSSLSSLSSSLTSPTDSCSSEVESPTDTIIPRTVPMIGSPDDDNDNTVPASVYSDDNIVVDRTAYLSLDKLSIDNGTPRSLDAEVKYDNLIDDDSCRDIDGESTVNDEELSTSKESVVSSDRPAINDEGNATEENPTECLGNKDNNADISCCQTERSDQVSMCNNSLSTRKSD